MEFDKLPRITKLIITEASSVTGLIVSTLDFVLCTFFLFLSLIFLNDIIPEYPSVAGMSLDSLMLMISSILGIIGAVCGLAGTLKIKHSKKASCIMFIVAAITDAFLSAVLIIFNVVSGFSIIMIVMMFVMLIIYGASSIFLLARGLSRSGNINPPGDMPS